VNELSDTCGALAITWRFMLRAADSHRTDERTTRLRHLDFDVGEPLLLVYPANKLKLLGSRIEPVVRRAEQWLRAGKHPTPRNNQADSPGEDQDGLALLCGGCRRVRHARGHRRAEAGALLLGPRHAPSQPSDRRGGHRLQSSDGAHGAGERERRGSQHRSERVGDSESARRCSVAGAPAAQRAPPRTLGHSLGFQPRRCSASPCAAGDACARCRALARSRASAERSAVSSPGRWRAPGGQGGRGRARPAPQRRAQARHDTARRAAPLSAAPSASLARVGRAVRVASWCSVKEVLLYVARVRGGFQPVNAKRKKWPPVQPHWSSWRRRARPRRLSRLPVAGNGVPAASRGTSAAGRPSPQCVPAPRRCRSARR